MNIKVNDPFEINTEKMNILALVLSTLSEHFPKHQTCSSTLHSGSYTYHDGEPSIVRIDKKSISHIRFGIISQQEADNRPRLLRIPIGDKPKQQIIGAVHLHFSTIEAVLSKTVISVFGTQFKPNFVMFANDFEKEGLRSLNGLVELNIEREYPLFL